MESSAAIAATMRWLNEAVVGLNLCPFARPVIEQNAIRITETSAATRKAVLEVMATEIKTLQANPTLATTLVVLPQSFGDFYDFLALVDDTEHFIAKHDLDYDFQLASFHPDYLFAGEESTAPSHFTNRSPHPILHILRAEDVEKAIANLSHPERIYEANIKRVNELGSEYFTALLQRCKQK